MLQDKIIGLTGAEVAEQIRLCQTNKDKQKKSNSYFQIICRNVFTFFNLINISLAVLILLGGINERSVRNVLFLGVVICNTAIGLFQEIRAKRATDRLKILTKGKVIALRDGAESEIYTDDIVLGDVIILTAGSQVPADCVVIAGACTVDESVLTGEADGVSKTEGSGMMSGSFVANGTCYARVVAVGSDSYGHRIAAEARAIKGKKSDIVHTMNIILGVMSVLILPLGIGLFLIQYNDCGVYSDSIIRTSAAVIGMLPEGMVLLSSTVFAVADVMLARRRVLSQDLYSAEALARTDVICLDKTGTLTEGRMEVVGVVPLCDCDLNAEFRRFVAASTDRNQTANALRDRFGGDENTACCFTAFDSERKCSSAEFDDCSLTLGAPEFICENIASELKAKIDELSSSFRVLALVKDKTPIALVTLADVVRPQAAKTLEYFYNEGVDVKIISGDNAHTVSAVAERAGVKNHDKYIDMRTVAETDIPEIARTYTVFGRVTPYQKRALVSALKSDGHTVAMVGDGVNDALALRESDCAIAPASGTDMARDAAKLVLLDSDFDALPEVVRQGRRSINNLKRSVSLFLIKIVYSLILSVAFLLLPKPYPFEPIHLTLITFVSVAAPGFLLSFEPNSSRVEGKFIVDIITRSLPGGTAIACGVIFTALVHNLLGLTHAEYVPVCVISSGIIGLINLMRVCSPFTPFRLVLFTVMSSLFAVGVLFLKGLFSLNTISPMGILMLVLSLAVSVAVYAAAAWLTKLLTKKIRGKK